MACEASSSLIVSPTLTGRLVKTVPASVRCIPSTRISLTTNGSIARAEGAYKPRVKKKKRLSLQFFNLLSSWFELINFFIDMQSACYQSTYIIIKRYDHHKTQHRKPYFLPNHHYRFRDGFAS